MVSPNTISGGERKAGQYQDQQQHDQAPHGDRGPSFALSPVARRPA